MHFVVNGVVVAFGTSVAKNGKTYGNLCIEQDGRVWSLGCKPELLIGLDKYKVYDIYIDAFLYQGRWILTVESLKLLT